MYKYLNCSHHDLVWGSEPPPPPPFRHLPELGSCMDVWWIEESEGSGGEFKNKDCFYFITHVLSLFFWLASLASIRQNKCLKILSMERPSSFFYLFQLIITKVYFPSWKGKHYQTPNHQHTLQCQKLSCQMCVCGRERLINTKGSRPLPPPERNTGRGHICVTAQDTETLFHFVFFYARSERFAGASNVCIVRLYVRPYLCT